MTPQHWYERTSWLWMILGGFYLLVYTYWYIPAFRTLPESITNPPAPYPWHWPLDVVATFVPGVVLLYFGFRRVAEIGLTDAVEVETTDTQLGNSSALE